MNKREALNYGIDWLIKRNERLSAALLNIQAMAERGSPIDHAKLAQQCRYALNPEEAAQSAE